MSASPHSQIIEIDPLSDRRWDAFVKAHPSPRGHHLGGWASILRDCYGYKPKYIALEQGGDLAGVLPLVSSGRRLSGSRLSSLPTAKAAGPLASTHEDERRLLGAAVEITRRERLGSVFVRSEHPGLDHPAAGLAKTYQTQVLALQPPEQLLEQYKRESHNLYRGIRKAQKAALVVRESTSDAELRDWYRIYLATMRKHHSLPRRLRQLRMSRSLLGPAWRLVTVSNDGRVIAGGVFHELGDTVELIYSASDTSYLSLRPNHALYWQVIVEATERGRTAFDFGTSGSDSLRSFKTQWGAVARDVHLYCEQPTATSDTGASDESPSVRGRAISRAKALSDKLLAASPLLANRAIAAVVYRVA